MSGFAEVLNGLDQALVKVQRENAKVGRIGGASTFLAARIGDLKDWAAEQPEDFIPAVDLSTDQPLDQGEGTR